MILFAKPCDLIVHIAQNTSRTLVSLFGTDDSSTVARLSTNLSTSVIVADVQNIVLNLSD